MHSTASTLTLPSLTSDARERLLSQVHLHSLYEVFATLPDPRRKQGQRYELAFLLTCLVAGLLCNCNSTLALGQWCVDQRPLKQAKNDHHGRKDQSTHHPLVHGQIA